MKFDMFMYLSKAPKVNSRINSLIHHVKIIGNGWGSAHSVGPVQDSIQFGEDFGFTVEDILNSSVEG